MTPQQVYALTSESTTKDLGILQGCYYDHLPEVVANLYNLEQTRVEIRLIKNFYYDGRRIWRLGTVWFDDKPVMIIQNAGREGDDHRERFITDVQLYKDMVGYINSILPFEFASERVTPLDLDMPELTNFYGQDLNDPFQRHIY